MNENNGNGTSGGLLFDEEMCERYIFGELSPADQESFEETYFSDDAFFERYIAVKTELLDLLARGELSPEKRSRMEPHFQATPPRRRRIEDSALFTTSVTAVAKRRSDKTIAVLPSVEDDGFIVSLIRSIAAFFSSPRLAAFTVLLIAVAGALYLLNRSSSTDAGRELAVSVPSEPDPSPRDEVPVSPEVAAEEKDSGDEPAPLTDPSTDRSIDDESSPTDAYPRIRGSRKKVLTVGRKTPPSPSSNSPARERASSGFALTLSTVGRDNGRDAAPAEGLTQSVVLRSGATRGQGSANTLVLRSGNAQHWVNIILIFSGESYPKYVITVTDVQGNVVLKEDDLKEQKKEDGPRGISLRIDETSMFANQNRDYIAILQGQTSTGRLETIGEYYFHVQRIEKTPPPKQDGQLASEPVAKEGRELTGKVMDPNGDPVPKAVVTARNLATGMIRRITAHEDGTYSFVEMPSGKYEISVEAASLMKTVINDVDLTAAAHVELPIRMEEGVVVSVQGSDFDPRPSLTLQPRFSPGSAGVKRLELHGDSQVADIQLVAPVTGHSSFNATIRTVDGKTVYSRNLSRSQVVKGLINLSVRSTVLRSGNHVVQLRGRSKKGRFEPIAEFYFHVQKPD